MNIIRSKNSYRAHYKFAKDDLLVCGFAYQN